MHSHVHNERLRQLQLTCRRSMCRPVGISSGALHALLLGSVPEPWRDKGLAVLPPRSSEATDLSLGEVDAPLAVPTMPVCGVLGSLLVPACCNTASAGRWAGGGAAAAGSCTRCALIASQATLGSLLPDLVIMARLLGRPKADFRVAGEQWQGRHGCAAVDQTDRYSSA